MTGFKALGKSSRNSGIAVIELAMLVAIVAGIFAAGTLVRENQNLEKQAASPCKICVGTTCSNNNPPCIPDINECERNSDCQPPTPTRPIATKVPTKVPTKPPADRPTSKPTEVWVPPTKIPTTIPTTRPSGLPPIKVPSTIPTGPSRVGLPTINPKLFCNGFCIPMKAPCYEQGVGQCASLSQQCCKNLVPPKSTPTVTPTPLPPLLRLFKFWFPEHITPIITVIPTETEIPHQTIITPRTALTPTPTIEGRCFPGETTCTRGGYETCEEQRGYSGYWRCSDDGSWWSCIPCPAGWQCVEGKDLCAPLPPSPTPKDRCVAYQKRCRGQENGGKFACGLNQIGTCRADGSGYDCQNCPAGYVCPAGGVECLRSMPTISCHPGETVCAFTTKDQYWGFEHCNTDPGNRDLAICRADGSGYNCQSCPAGYVCPAGEAKCLLPTPTTTAWCIPNETKCFAQERNGGSRCYSDELGVCSADGSGYDCISCPFYWECKEGDDKCTAIPTPTTACTPGETICSGDWFGFEDCNLGTDLATCRADGKGWNCHSCPDDRPRCYLGKCIAVSPTPIPSGLNTLTAEKSGVKFSLERIPILGNLLKLLGIIKS